MYAEVRIGDKWEKVGDVFINSWYRDEYPIDKFNTPMTEHPYDNRNYMLFAVLADVRNGYGFAGVKTHEPVKPLFADRGVPANASTEYKQIVAEWDCDGHSHTYATVAELQAVDWSSIYVDCTGLLDVDEYERIRNTGENPESWCANASGYYVQHVTPEVYEREYRNVILDEPTNADEMMSVYIRWSWKEKLSDALSEFIETSLPQLEMLGPPEDTRIVFFFDN
jgi:hypothetical protein